MKYLFTLFIINSIGLVSCDKNKTYCWKCVLVSQAPSVDPNNAAYYCDKTQQWINDYEASETYILQDSTGQYQATTVCTKQ